MCGKVIKLENIRPIIDQKKYHYQQSIYICTKSYSYALTEFKYIEDEINIKITNNYHDATYLLIDLDNVDLDFGNINKIIIPEDDWRVLLEIHEYCFLKCKPIIFFSSMDNVEEYKPILSKIKEILPNEIPILNKEGIKTVLKCYNLAFSTIHYPKSFICKYRSDVLRRIGDIEQYAEYGGKAYK